MNKYSKIKSIKPAGKKDIYHLSVKNNQNFFANNLCVHNCYRGSLGVKLYLDREMDLKRKSVFKAGEPVAQFVLYKLIVADEVKFVDDIVDTDRGEKGFGSTHEH